VQASVFREKLVKTTQKTQTTEAELLCACLYLPSNLGATAATAPCSRLLMIFGQNFWEEWQIWVSEPHFGEVRGDAQPWLIAHWKGRGRLSIRLNWTFFAICYDSGVMRRYVYSSAVFTGVDLFAPKFYLDNVVSHQPFLTSEN